MQNIIEILKNKKIMLLAGALFVLISFTSFFIRVGADKAKSTAAENNAAAVKNEKDNSVHLAFVGDLLMHTAERKSGYNPQSNTYDFNGFFGDIKPFLKGKDFVVGSFETPVSKQTSDKFYSGYPAFNNPPEFIGAIKSAGINVLVTSNNHVVDKGPKGAFTTMELIEKYGLPYTGTFKTLHDRQSNPVLFLDKKGIKLALMNYTEMTNMSAGNTYMVNYIDTNKIKNDIQFTKSNKADATIVWLHFGTEYQRQATQKQKQIVEEVAKAGADIIIGSHPHVIEPMEVLDIDGRKVFVAYSLGNFISNQYWRYSTDGMVLNMDIVKNENKTEFKNITYIPTAVVREYHGHEIDSEKTIKANDKESDFITGAISHGVLKGSEVKFRIVPAGQGVYNFEKGIDKTLSQKDYIRLKTTWDDTTGLIGENEFFKVFRDNKTRDLLLGNKVESPKTTVKPQSQITTKLSTTAKPTVVKQTVQPVKKAIISRY